MLKIKLFIFVTILISLIDCQQNDSEICGTVTMTEDFTDNVTRIDEHPWIVGIGFWYPQRKITHINCAGALISKKFVVTAASCIKKGDLEHYPSIICLGEWNLNTTIDCQDGICADKPIDISIDEIFTRYDKWSEYINDIALIKLTKEVQYSKWIQPICLPDESVHNRIKSYVGATFIVSGWSQTPDFGQTNIKLKRHVAVSENKLCELYPSYKSHYDSYLHFCSETSQACNGDAPVLGIDTSNPDRPYWYLFGLFLKADKCFHSPQIFTKIVPLIGWILEVMANNQ